MDKELRQKIIELKTDCRCSLCGTSGKLMYRGFIPTWTRVPKDIENMIPLCKSCYDKNRYNFIEIGKLEYVHQVYIEQLMRYYQSIAKYLYKYVRMYGEYRIGDKIDVQESILIISSYEKYIRDNRDKLDWENY